MSQGLCEIRYGGGGGGPQVKAVRINAHPHAALKAHCEGVAQHGRRGERHLQELAQAEHALLIPKDPVEEKVAGGAGFAAQLFLRQSAPVQLPDLPLINIEHIHAAILVMANFISQVLPKKTNPHELKLETQGSQKT